MFADALTLTDAVGLSSERESSVCLSLSVFCLSLDVYVCLSLSVDLCFMPADTTVIMWKVCVQMHTHIHTHTHTHTHTLGNGGDSQGKRLRQV